MRLIDADMSDEIITRAETIVLTDANNDREINHKMQELCRTFRRFMNMLPTVDPEIVQTQWIPVTERLPECGEHYTSNDVLVSVDYRPDDPDETKDTFISIDHVCFNCFKQGVFSIERDNPYDTEPSPYFVTHWMPLPESPVDNE